MTLSFTNQTGMHVILDHGRIGSTLKGSAPKDVNDVCLYF